MRVLLTRPSREAKSWLQALETAGKSPIALPLIEIAPVADLRPLVTAWRQISDYQAIMFVSANAVDFFFAGQPANPTPPFLDGAGSIRAWATGPGTARALARAGASARLMALPGADALQFDSESLWAEVAGQVGARTRVLIVRGEDSGSVVAAGADGTGRDWLAKRILEAGGSVGFLVVYRRQVPIFTATQQDQVRAASTDGSVWLFSSSQAIANLTGSFPAQSWARARAIATHPRIAQTARDHGFGVVYESRPAIADVIASIESLA